MKSEAQADTPNKKRLSLGVIFLTIFIDLVGFSIIFPLFPSILDYYLAKDGGSGILASLLSWLDELSATLGGGDRFTPVLFGGVLGSLYATLQFFFAPFWGGLSDRHGRRPILIITTLGMALSYLFWIFAGNFGLLIAARVIGGMMSGNLSVATAAVSDVTTDQDRAKGMGIIGVAFGLGFVTGPAIGGIAVNLDLLHANPALASYGINPFSFVAIAATLLSVVNFIWIRSRFIESLPPEKRHSDFSSRNPIKRMFQPLPASIRKTNFAYLIYILAFSGMEFTLTFLGVERFGFSQTQLAIMMVYIGFMLIITQGGIVRRLAPKIGNKKCALIGLVTVTGGLAALSQANSTSSLYIGLALMAIGAGLCSPTLTALVSLYSDDRDQGKSLGAFRSIGSLGRAIGPILASIVFWWLGSESLYIGGAILTLFAVLAASRLPEPSSA